MKLIYTFMEEAQKLKILRYNKNLQKAIDISIINYKFFSERYIIFGSKGFGKEYNGSDDSLIFEGKYLKGEKNGKGKEYDKKGIKIFEGKYLKGKRNGKGKEYNYEGALKFEGGYLNGKRNGKGKEYEYGK